MKKIVAGIYGITPGHLVNGRVAPDLGRGSGRDNVTFNARGHLPLNHKNGIFLRRYQRVIVRGIVAETQKFGHLKRGQTTEQKTHHKSENNLRTHGSNPRQCLHATPNPVANSMPSCLRCGASAV